MPPGWQIAPDKRASSDRQTLARSRPGVSTPVVAGVMKQAAQN
jgi:hypothetical protein